MDSDFLTRFRTVDREAIISRFFGTISWADECITDVYRSNFVVLKHNETWFVPCLFSDLESLKGEIGMFLCLAEEKHPNGKICVIIDGDLTDIEIDAVCHFLLTIRLTPFFITAESSINHSRWLMNQMDGFDWGRTFAAFCEKGRDAKPVMQWD